MGEVSPHQAGGFGTDGSPRRVRQSQREVSGPTAKVENAGVGQRQDIGKAAGQAFPPSHIEAQREEMIQQVVTGGDAAEHFPHLTRGGLLIMSARRARAG